MPGFPGDRIKVFSVTTGTGTTLATNGPAVSSLFCSVAEAGLINGVEYHYIIEQGGDFEHSFGIYNAGGFIGRNVVASKINGVYSATAKLNLGGAQVVYFPYLKAVMTPPLLNFDPLQIVGGSATIIIRAPKCKVTLIGGGAGGGGAYVTGCNASAGGNGGSGAVLIKLLTGLTPGNTLNLTVGANGVGGGYTANGTSGGNTSLVSGTQSIAPLTAGGGAPGIGSHMDSTFQNYGVSGAGGVATNGDLNLNGEPGSFVQGIPPSTGWAIYGGNTPLGFGIGGFHGLTGADQNGSPGTGFGSGGGGGNSYAYGFPSNGGAGAPGLAIFEWYA